MTIYCPQCGERACFCEDGAKQPTIWFNGIDASAGGWTPPPNPDLATRPGEAGASNLPTEYSSGNVIQSLSAALEYCLENMKQTKRARHASATARLILNQIKAGPDQGVARCRSCGAGPYDTLSLCGGLCIGCEMTDQ